MKVFYNTSFFRDVKKATPQIRADLLLILELIEKANSIQDIPNLKKLKGAKTAYRVKLDTYRICFHYDDDILTFHRFLSRKEVYRFFP